MNQTAENWFRVLGLGFKGLGLKGLGLGLGTGKNNPGTRTIHGNGALKNYDGRSRKMKNNNYSPPEAHRIWVYGDLITIYPKPYSNSIYFKGTITLNPKP